ncbi:unnamed protein product [Effrenium voratum]|uniref:VTT domain-containing protein n=1 Tax=Effrenium voratum TaxID=2562239 RepID=A0AA36I1L3_9DINO|nr:unnamed protein product [Effrenium voratum]
MTAEQEAILSKRSYMRGKSDQALGDELNKLQGLSYEYWKMRVYRVFSKESVKQGFVSFLTYGNAIFILIFLRTVVPRLLVVGSLDDFFGFANEIGVPNRQTLNDVIRSLASYSLPLKVGIYTLAFIAEKLTLISEILPVQIALKTMSPVVFGGLLPGALIAATCETIGATVNFFVGRTFFFQRVREFQLPGEPVLGDAPWFGRLERAAEQEGLKLTLLLRLSHILPVPFDSYWYILGALPVGVLEFIVAHWVGCLKTAFLDASLGLLLLTSVVNFEGAEKQNIIIAESVGFAVVALLVQTFATTLVKDILGLDEPKQPKEPKAAELKEPKAEASGESHRRIMAKASQRNALKERRHLNATSLTSSQGSQHAPQGKQLGQGARARAAGASVAPFEDFGRQNSEALLDTSRSASPKWKFHRKVTGEVDEADDSKRSKPPKWFRRKIAGESERPERSARFAHAELDAPRQSDPEVDERSKSPKWKFQRKIPRESERQEQSALTCLPWGPATPSALRAMQLEIIFQERITKVEVSEESEARSLSPEWTESRKEVPERYARLSSRSPPVGPDEPLRLADRAGDHRESPRSRTKEDDSAVVGKGERSRGEVPERYARLSTRSPPVGPDEPLRLADRAGDHRESPRSRTKEDDSAVVGKGERSRGEVPDRYARLSSRREPEDAVSSKPGRGKKAAAATEAGRSAAPGSEDETFGKAPSSAARQRRLGNKEDGEDAVTPRSGTDSDDSAEGADQDAGRVRPKKGAAAATAARTASIELEDEPSAASAFGPAAGRSRLGKKAAGEAATAQRSGADSDDSAPVAGKDAAGRSSPKKSAGAAAGRSTGPDSEDETSATAPSAARAAGRQSPGNKADAEDAARPRSGTDSDDAAASADQDAGRVRPKKGAAAATAARTAGLESEDEPSAAAASGPAAGRSRLGKRAAGETATAQRSGADSEDFGLVPCKDAAGRSSPKKSAGAAGRSTGPDSEDETSATAPSAARAAGRQSPGNKADAEDAVRPRSGTDSDDAAASADQDAGRVRPKKGAAAATAARTAGLESEDEPSAAAASGPAAGRSRLGKRAAGETATAQRSGADSEDSAPVAGKDAAGRSSPKKSAGAAAGRSTGPDSEDETSATAPSAARAAARQRPGNKADAEDAVRPRSGTDSDDAAASADQDAGRVRPKKGAAAATAARTAGLESEDEPSAAAASGPAAGRSRLGKRAAGETATAQRSGADSEDSAPVAGKDAAGRSSPKKSAGAAGRSTGPDSEDETSATAPSAARAAGRQRLVNKADGEDAVRPRSGTDSDDAAASADQDAGRVRPKKGAAAATAARTAGLESEDEPSAAAASGPAAGRSRLGKRAAGETATAQRSGADSEDSAPVAGKDAAGRSSPKKSAGAAGRTALGLTRKMRRRRRLHLQLVQQGGRVRATRQMARMQ